MIPDIHTGEKLALAHHEQWQLEADHERLLGALPGHHSHPMRYMAARLRTFLIAFGTRLRQLEQPRKQMAVE